MLELLKQRRVWATIITVVIGVLALFKVTWGPDVELVSQAIVDVITLGGAFLTAILALWSYIKPKAE